MAADVPLAHANGFHLVSTVTLQRLFLHVLTNTHSFIPESPRWLITKDRHEEAYGILAKYHAEGDHNSEFVKAEFAHMQTTIQIEMEHSKSSWGDLIRTEGMRRRMLISAMLGLFTQWSGNTLISYYLSDLLEMVGRTDSVFKQQINVAIACWSLVCGVTIALCVTRFKRRAMYFVCTIGLLVVYISWTISMERAVTAADAGSPNQAANGAVLFIIFAYKPFYGIGFNALTYSKVPRLLYPFPFLPTSTSSPPPPSSTPLC